MLKEGILGIDTSNKLSGIKLFLVFCALSFIGIYLTYSPAVAIPFFHHDIYALSTNGVAANKFSHLIHFFLNDNWLLNPRVRPFWEISWEFNVLFGGTLDGISHLRVAGLIFTSLFAGAFAYWLNRFGFGFFGAIVLSIMVCCLPGIQTAVIMSAWFIVFAILMAFLAYVLVNQGFKYWASSKLKFLLLLIGGLISLFVSFFTYPAVSSFYLVPTLVCILFQPLTGWSERRKIVIREVIIFSLCCAVYFALARYIQIHMAPADLPTPYAFNLNSNIIDRIGPLFKVFPSLWNIQYGFRLEAKIVYSLIILGILAKYLTRDPATYSSSSVNQSIFSIFILLGLATSAYILQPEFYVFTRILFVFQVMSLFILVWALKAICDAVLRRESKNAFLIILISLFFAGSLITSSIVAKSALNDSLELSYLTNFLANHIIHKDKISRIHIVGLKITSKENFTGMKPRDDIFNINSTIYRQDSYYMVDAALKQILGAGNYSLTNCALDEFVLMHMDPMDCVKNAPKNSIVVTYSRQGEPVIDSPDTLVVNMSSDELYFPTNGKLALS